jgi:hypothetical protein
MECDRCQGLMLKDYFVAMVGPSQQTWLCAWRCLDCGREIDPLTLTTHQKVVLFGTGTATDVV